MVVVVYLVVSASAADCIKISSLKRPVSQCVEWDVTS